MNNTQLEAYGPILAGKLGKLPKNVSRNTMFESGDRFFPFQERTGQH
jgi:hypothetical protein